MVIDVRRHAERASGTGAIGGLSAAGLATARRLQRQGEGFALVISSPRERARSAAMAMADRVDEIEPILDVAPDETLTQDQFDTLRSQDAVAELLRSSTAARRFAEDQLSLWERVGGRVADGGARALLVTHGGNIELPAVLLATRLGTSIDPLPLEYCEGVRVCFEAGRPVALERLRADQ